VCVCVCVCGPWDSRRLERERHGCFWTRRVCRFLLSGAFLSGKGNIRTAKPSNPRVRSPPTTPRLTRGIKPRGTPWEPPPSIHFHLPSVTSLNLSFLFLQTRKIKKPRGKYALCFQRLPDTVLYHIPKYTVSMYTACTNRWNNGFKDRRKEERNPIMRELFFF